MKKGPNSLSVPDWLKIARKDWIRVGYMLEKEDAEAAAVFLQQSLEKHLKAFLLQRGWKLRKIHELDALLDDAVKYDPDLGKFHDLCERVSGYYFVDRYPLLDDVELTCTDIKEDLKQAKRFVQAMFPVITCAMR